MELLLSVDRADRRPLQLQLFDAIRELILSGALKPGQKLPSSRNVADQLGIGRNTVVLAYERLATEDYVSSREKAGIFVNSKLPDASVLIRNGHATVSPGAERIRLGRIPAFSGRALDLWRPKSERPKYDFFVGRPHPDSFPTKFWQRAAARHLTYAHGAQIEYGDPRGLAALRKALVDHLRATRGIEADPDQILVTSGIQSALNLLARVFLGGRTPLSVATENPCYQGAAYVFSSYGARLFPVPVDEQGLIVSQLDRFSGSLIYVTPSHQFPTGYTLSLDRRLHLLDWANRTGSYVIEDDYDSDFRYDGPPLAALAGLDRRGRVIYLGTFSKSIGAGIRLGYAVLPRHLLDQGRIVKTLLDHGAPWLEQSIVADFLREGAFLKHLRRIRSAYMATRDTLVDAIDRHFPGGLLSGKECGMHMMWTLPPDLPDAEQIRRLAAAQDVGLYPLAAAAGYEYGSRRRIGDRVIVLGYTALSPADVREGIGRVAAALRTRGSPDRPAPP